MKRAIAFAFIILSCFTTISCATDGGCEPPRSGTAIKAVSNGGLAPLSFSMCISSHVIGYAYISSKDHPDLFFHCPAGMSDHNGLIGTNICRYAGETDDGSLLYEAPEHLSSVPWENKTGALKVLQRGDSVYCLWLSRKQINVSVYDEKWNCFGATQKALDITDVPFPIVSFDVICNRDGKTAEIIMICKDSSVYLPRKEVAESYYNSAGIYNGELPYSGVFQASIDMDEWTFISDVAMTSKDMHTLLSPGGIAGMLSEDGDLKGIVISNKLGCFKYISSDDRGKIMDLRDKEGKVILNPSLTSAIAMIDGDGDNVVNDIISSGEGASYYYRFNDSYDSNGEPVFDEGKKIMMKSGELYAGSLTVPNVADWDGDGVFDIVAGNSEGRLLFFKNKGTNEIPEFGLSENLRSEGEEICFRAGYYELQGPLESAWGYLCPTVFDWNQDGLPDIVFSGNSGKFEVMLNEGTRTKPQLSGRRVLTVDGLELYGTWRVKPALALIDGSCCLVIMDDKERLHAYRKTSDYTVDDYGLLKMEDGNCITGYRWDTNTSYGQRGREKLELTDWDSDGDLDLLIGTARHSSFPDPHYGLPWARNDKRGMQVLLMINGGSNQNPAFGKPMQLQFKGKDFYLGGHSNSPAACMLGDTTSGVNLLVGCESGKFFYFKHSDITFCSLWN